MIKLYKTSDPIRYWEAWITASEVTIHWGVLGDRGQTREIAIKAGENPNQIIEREAKEPRKKVSADSVVEIGTAHHPIRDRRHGRGK